jgi:hypoxanthine phosphoribosyltransferase
MIKKHYYSWQDVETMCTSIVLQMYKDAWRPDYIVGITRGGSIPATIISNMLDIRCESLKVSLRDANAEPESNLWMAEDAFGYVQEEDRELIKSRWDPARRSKILIVDDINDSGATFNWIKEDWPAGCLPSSDGWANVWGNTVRFATLTNNLASSFDDVSYTAHEIDKLEKDVWLVYPWEKLGTYDAT